MAKVLDEVLDDVSQDYAPLEDGTSPVNEQPKVAQEPEEDLPEKYRGKTAKEIALMHQEAEKLIGKQGSEVGELRKVVDDFIKTQTSKDLKTPEPEVSEEDFFIDPKTSVDKAINNHPAVKQAQEAAVQMKRQEVLNRLTSEYPNLMDTVNNEAFIEWVKGSRVRTELMVRAEQQFDYDSAKELLDTWKEKQEVVKKASETLKMDRNQQLKAADVSTSNSTEPASKKKYRRSDIILLMQRDPAKYEAMADEIMAAYKEGRVI